MTWNKTDDGRAVENGKIRLLTPKGKRQKYAKELTTGIRHDTHFNKVVDKNGVVVKISANERAYKQGAYESMLESTAMHNKSKGVADKDNVPLNTLKGIQRRRNDYRKSHRNEGTKSKRNSSKKNKK